LNQVGGPTLWHSVQKRPEPDEPAHSGWKYKPVPPPLKNDSYPNGLSWLTKEQQERVNKANELYRITCELCQQRNILWSCENPGRSFMWQTTQFVVFFRRIEHMSTDFTACLDPHEGS